MHNRGFFCNLNPHPHDYCFWIIRKYLCFAAGAKCIIVILFPLLVYVTSVHTRIDMLTWSFWSPSHDLRIWSLDVTCGRLRLKCDGTHAETRFRLSAKRTSPFKSAEGRQFSRLLASEVCASAVVTLDTPCSEVVWRVLAIHYIRPFPLHFPSRSSPCAIIFRLDSTDCPYTSQFQAC